MSDTEFNQRIAHYQREGYLCLPQFITGDTLSFYQRLLREYLMRWKSANADFYHTRAVNAAYLTAPDLMNETQQLALFHLAEHTDSQPYLKAILQHPYRFLNSQLFFNPYNKQQRNYWHRDSQYHLSIDKQKQLLSQPPALHFRIALFDEPGIEVIPKSHRQWDREIELAVRLEQNGYQNWNDLPHGKCLPLQAGDGLIFDANMIHRGLYGDNRLALDLLYCTAGHEALSFARADCFPNPQQQQQLHNPELFSI